MQTTDIKRINEAQWIVSPQLHCKSKKMGEEDAWLTRNPKLSYTINKIIHTCHTKFSFGSLFMGRYLGENKQMKKKEHAGYMLF